MSDEESFKEEPVDKRIDDFYKEWRRREVENAGLTIGPGPFYCPFCGKQMVEGGHMFVKFYLCPDAGEFTWGPPTPFERVEIDGTSYAVAERGTTPEELERQRRYYEMCADAHKRSAERREEIKAEVTPPYERRER